MERIRRFNPLAFHKWPVTILISAVYIGLVAGLLYVHHVVPSAPMHSGLVQDTNLTEAWSDLQHLSARFHPFNSQHNDHVRDWLLQRIETIVRLNHASFEKVHQPETNHDLGLASSPHDVVLYDDLVSNATFSASNSGSTSVYFEGSNIIVKIKGADSQRSPSSDKCVLVNAHFDSVSTGFGATDDGVGVVSILQLIKHYTTPGNRPRTCLVALLNNGEEDYLNGARVFGQHPISSYISAFLNLEGAGAGGRATVFRGTDAELMNAYSTSPNPFGTALSSDGFRQGLVRSQTDYFVFNGNLGFRGLDVAFFEPRSRYHTSADSAKETSMNSLWHMLSAALATTKSMLNHDEYAGQADTGSEPVYFDLFGRALGLLTLSVLVNISIALLVVGPLVLVIFAFFLVQRDKWYVFAGTAYSDPLDPHTPDEQVAIDLQGRRGIFRTIITMVLAIAIVIGLALLLSKANPMIVYSSPYAVWSTTLSAFLLISWFGLSAADRTRPTAFQRLYAIAWLYMFSWALLIVLTIFEMRLRLTGAYIGLFLNASVLAALIVGLLELLALPRRDDYIHRAANINGEGSIEHTPAATSPRPLSRHLPNASDENEANEESPLLGRSLRSHSRLRLGAHSRSALSSLIHTSSPSSIEMPTAEQPWSVSLPSTFWIVQLLLLAPLNVILISQIGLFFTSALAQTLADGGSALTIYLSVALLSALLLLPVIPFIHRLSPREPLFLLAVLVGTLIYNLTAFPFSRENRLKVYFQQRLDVDDSNSNIVVLTGVERYLRQVIQAIPSATGQELKCTDPGQGAITGLTTCSWHSSLLPDVAQSHRAMSVGENYGHHNHMRQWLTIKATRTSEDTATFRLSGANTRACKLLFDQSVVDYNITNSSSHDERFVKVPEGGLTELRLWHRDWNREWQADVLFKSRQDDNAEHEELTGRAVCLWADANEPSAIPALTELKHNMPIWSVVTKMGDGLVEGSRNFTI